MNRNNNNPRCQRGATAVEFALLVPALLLLLFGIVEFGRFLYLYNTVQEVTRRAAREAVVSCTDSTTKDGIMSKAVFGTGSSGVSLPAGGEITDARVIIDYLDKNQAHIADFIACPAPYDGNILRCASNDPACVSYVRVQVCNQQGRSCVPVKYKPMIGLFSFLEINIPGSTVIMPAESLGYTFTL